jgi:HEXXH motif-containing protein
VTGLLLPPADAPLRRLEALRRAEAWRLLKEVARGPDRPLAERLADVARARPEDAAALLAEPVAAMLWRTGRLAEAVARWRGLLAGPPGDAARPLRGSVVLALTDENPLAMVEAHPDKAGNALALGERSEDEWRRALASALELVAQHLPGVAAEMDFLRLRVIPVGYEPEKHLSASYREYVGACYLTLHPRVDVLAEALVHEFQHNKLNLASYHDELLENDMAERVRSPVRPDLRPLWGVLLAAHAFIPVAELVRRAGQRARFAEIVAQNDAAMATLAEHARPTKVGAALLAEMAMRHEEHLADARA